MLKITRFFILTLMVFSIKVQAQFTFQRIDPAIINVTISDSSQQIKSHGVVRNTTSSNITLNISIINRYVTPGWDSIGICDWHICYSPGQYSITSVIAPNVNETLYVYFSPYMHPGTGRCTVRINYQNSTIDQDFEVVANPIGIQQISSTIKDFSLGQNYPNPFNPVTKINFSIPKSNYVSLVVYDILGKEVKVLVNEKLSAGEYETDFDASDYPSGFYYYILKTDNFRSVKKMILIK